MKRLKQCLPLDYGPLGWGQGRKEHRGTSPEILEQEGQEEEECPESQLAEIRTAGRRGERDGKCENE